VSAFTVLVAQCDRVLVTRAGRRAAAGQNARQLLLARATGDYRRGNER
jgi:hypothetical protein